jgi:membrane-bound ClpP family serine protease
MALIHAYYTMNIGLHVMILFCFLTVFFFLFISKRESAAVSEVVSSSIKGNVDGTLTSLRAAEKQYPGLNIDWESVNDKAKNMEANSQGTSQYITDNNNKLKIISYSIIGGIFALLVVAFLYFQFYRKFALSYGQIIATNAITFAFVGLVEYLFFTNIASKYVAVTPSLINNSIIERIEDNTFKIINQEPAGSFTSSANKSQ